MTAPPDDGEPYGGATQAHPRRPADDQVLGRWLWRQLRSTWPLLLVGVAILVTAALTARAPTTGLPLDPASTRDDGTRALVDVLAELGRPAAVATPDALDPADVVLLLRDQLTPAQRARLRTHARDGGRIVVADPTSALAPDVVGGVGLLDRVLTGDCEVAALRDVRELRPGFDAVLFEVPDGATGCFAPGDRGAAVVIAPVGRGHIVSLGDPSLLTNSRLGAADHAPLAVQLLTPAGGGGITIVEPTLATADAADQRLSDLVPPWVRLAVIQLLVAFGVLVLWRARRLGRPLPDDAPVRLPAAELTTAVGALLARNRTHGASARHVADDTRRRLARQVGLAGNAEPDDVARSVSAVTGRDPATIVALLDPPSPDDDAALLETTTALAELEQTVHHNLTPLTESTDVH